MKRIDTTIASNLQRRYLQGESILTLLYVELRRMAGLILRELKTPPERVDEFSHEAASHICERYLKDQSYHIGSFFDVMKRACLDAKGERALNPSAGHRSRPKTKAHTTWIPIDNLRIPIPDEEIKEDDPAVLDGLSQYFARWKWYRPAIRQLSVYVSKRWMLDHSKQLKDIFLQVRQINGRSEDSVERARPSEQKEGRPGQTGKVQRQGGAAG
jgi:hypothetical protein